MIEANFVGILKTLRDAQVDVIVVGGGAGIAHGLAYTTYDVDVVYERSEKNLKRLVDALRVTEPYLRGAPPGLPFKWDVETLRRGLNFTLVTKLGNLDLLGEIAGGGTYSSLLPRSEPISFYGMTCQVVTLETLIHLKRAAGRVKDLEVIAQLEALREEREAAGGGQ